MKYQKRFVTPILITIITLMILVGGLYLYIKNSGTSNGVTATELSAVSDWKTYSDIERGFEFKYPEEWPLVDAEDWDLNLSLKGSPEMNIGEGLQKSERTMELLQKLSIEAYPATAFRYNIYSFTNSNGVKINSYSSFDRDTDTFRAFYFDADKTTISFSLRSEVNCSDCSSHVTGNEQFFIKNPVYKNIIDSIKFIKKNEVKAVDSTVVILFPNGGETFNTTDQLAIKWWDDEDAGDRDIYITDMKPQGVKFTIRSSVFMRSSGVDGNYINLWDISNIPVGKYKIQVCKSGTNECDFSDNYFTITPVDMK